MPDLGGKGGGLGGAAGCRWVRPASAVTGAHSRDAAWNRNGKRLGQGMTHSREAVGGAESGEGKGERGNGKGTGQEWGRGGEMSAGGASVQAS